MAIEYEKVSQIKSMLLEKLENIGNSLLCKIDLLIVILLLR